MKIVFDTDIGTNLDDSLALAYLLRNPECELVGVTTVTGQAGKRASLARELCRASGQEVPVYPGSENPLMLDQMQTEVPLQSGSTDLREWELVDTLQFLRSLIRNNPRQITLLTTGPVTNIALLFQLDPEIPALLAGMICMAGVYFPEAQSVRPKETNISLDPHGASKVFSMSPVSTRVVGLDVTLAGVKSKEEAAYLVDCYNLPPLTEQFERWLQRTNQVYFHDPIAAAASLNPGLCKWRQGTIRIDIETGESSLEGGTAHQVACSVDIDEFFEEIVAKRR